MDQDLDPAVTNADHYTVVLENDRVRVLAYADEPGDATTVHRHPDSVMHTLSSFRRLLVSDGVEREVELLEGTTTWLPAQEHRGVNIGDSPTRVLLVELKEPGPADGGATTPALGPQT